MMLATTFSAACAGATQSVRRHAGCEESGGAEPPSGYAMEGQAPWKPVRVFNDGRRTYLDFPAALRDVEPPSLFIDGDLSSTDELVQVNTSWDPRALRMTVDSVFQRAVLIAGVNRAHARVRIAASASCARSMSGESGE
jgi:type IV secretory pathway VirB9-like protein